MQTPSTTPTASSLPASSPKPPRGRTPRPSKRGKWRTAVLVTIHVAIAAHILHWVLTGSTLTPIEPSESMQTLELGVVNAGFIFFVVAILATMIFGRFFCGWACHVVAYQDASSWLLKKFGMKPKPIRSRLLIWAPMVLAIYMFVWPTLKRLVRGAPAPQLDTHFSTELFWESFAGVGMGILTLFVCGVLIVYWLGSKGFCTYGCPYGAFFGVADRFSPGRIRVTDACKGCRHCTDTCTSNVLVHEEVLKYGAVVDAGCMKCLDCVNVCPEDALYFGFGKPALLGSKSKPRKKTANAQSGKVDATDLAVFAGTAGFSTWWLHDPTWLQDSIESTSQLWLTVPTALLIATVFVRARHAKGKVFDFSFGEEVSMAVLFLLSSQLVYRALYSSVPNLLAIGLGAITAVMAIMAWRLLVRRQDLTWQHHVLRSAGSLTRAGKIFAGAAILWGAFTIHSAFLQHHSRSAVHLIEKAVPLQAAEREPLLDASLEHIATFDRWALFEDATMRAEEGNIAYSRGQLELTDRALARSLELNPRQPPIWQKRIRAQMSQDDLESAHTTLAAFSERYREAAQPMWRELVGRALQSGRTELGIRMLEDFVERYPEVEDARAALEQARGR